MEYKRNQIEEAIFRTFGAREERRNELKFRLKRLLVNGALPAQRWLVEGLHQKHR